MKKKLLLFAVCLLMFIVFDTKVAHAEDENLTAEEMSGAVEVTFGAQGTHAWGDDDTPLVTKIVVPENGMITAQIAKTTHSDFGVLAMKYFLYDSNGKYLNYYKDEEDERLTAIWKCGLPKGTYYIKNDIEYWSTGSPVSNYCISFKKGNYFEKEMNDTKATATPIVTDKVYTGELGNGFSNIESDAYKDTSDVYKVYLKKGWTYRVKTSKLEGTTISKLLTKKMELGELFDLGTGKNIVAPYTGYYYVQFYNYGNDQYEYTFSVRTVAPIGTSLNKLKAGKKTITASWTKRDVDGYYIELSTKKNNFKNAKSVKVSKRKSSYTIKKLKSGKKYYVRIRTYRTISGKKYYSKWSKVKSITVK